MDRKLEDLLKKKRKQSAAGVSVDWDERLDVYRQAIEELYQLILQALAEPITDGAVVHRRRPKTVSEDYIGTYSVEDLLLTFGDEHVRFSPRGRNIAGAEGRVDVVGERGEANLIRRDGAWWMVQARQPKLRTVRVQESNLADLLNSVMRE